MADKTHEEIEADRLLAEQAEADAKTRAAARKPRAKVEQVGEGYVVVWPQVSLFVPADADGKTPSEITLGDGRKVKVEDEHVVLVAGTPVAATSVVELERFRLLASVGALRGAPVAP